MNNNETLKPQYKVPVNIEERDDCYRVMVYALSFPKERITTRVVDDTLVITGNREQHEGAVVEFLKQEFPVHFFERKLQLNGLVETDCISSRFEEGVLTVFLPKKQETSLRRRIQEQLNAAIFG